MSYILEALKKLEQKREQEEAPKLLSFSLGPDRERKKGAWPYIVAAVLLLNAVVMMWWLSGREAERPKGTYQAPPYGQEEKKGREGALKERAAGHGRAHVATVEGETQHPKRQAARQTAEEGQGPAVPGREAPVRPTRPLAQGPASPPPAVNSGREAAPGGPGGQAMASEAPNAGRAGAVERPPSAQAPRDRRKPASGRVYEMAQLPSSVRGGLPQFRISGHAYSRDPGTRVVRVNERILQEGQELAPGLRLDEIVPDGVVFSFQGYRFKVHLGMADGTSGEKEPEAQSAGQGP